MLDDTVWKIFDEDFVCKAINTDYSFEEEQDETEHDQGSNAVILEGVSRQPSRYGDHGIVTDDFQVHAPHSKRNTKTCIGRHKQSDLETESMNRKAELEEAQDDKCPHCGGVDLAIEDGNYVCKRCSTVVTRFIDNAPEWRYYGSEDNRSTNPTRCGPPTNEFLPTLGASVSMSFGGGRGRGRGSNVCRENVNSSVAEAKERAKERERAKANRGNENLDGNDGGDEKQKETKVPPSVDYGSSRMMQRYQMWNSMTHQERNLYAVFDTLTVNAANHGIPGCILDEAKSLYKRVSSVRILRGENRGALIACSIYMACKTNDVPRSVKEVASIFGIRTAALTKSCKLFHDVMASNVMASKPIDFIPRFCSKLGLGRDVVLLATHVVGVVEDLSVSCESTPPSLVASVIFMCCTVLDIATCRKKVADACQISHVTISKCHKKLLPVQDRLIPDPLDKWMTVAVGRDRVR